MKVGYARVSTTEQHEDRQLRTLEELGAEKTYIDKLSGKDTNRPQLNEMLEFVREGDTVIVSEYSRLARSTKDLLNIIENLKAKNVSVVSHKENFDTSTPQGKLMLTFFAGMAEFEREIMLQRQREGIAIAKEQGKYKGRKKITPPPEWKQLKEAFMTRKITLTDIAKRFKVSRNTVYKWIEEEKKTMYFYSDMERHAVKAFQEAYREAEREGSLSLLAVKQVGSILAIAEHRAVADELATKIM